MILYIRVDFPEFGTPAIAMCFGVPILAEITWSQYLHLLWKLSLPPLNKVGIFSPVRGWVILYIPQTPGRNDTCRGIPSDKYVAGSEDSPQYGHG